MPIAGTTRSYQDSNVRVFTADERGVWFRDGARVTADSVSGYGILLGPGAAELPESFALSTADIIRVEERRGDTGRTVLLVGGSAVAAGAIYLAALLITVLPAD